MVKSVQRGSLAEVRPLGGAALAGAGRAGRLPPVPQGTSWNVPPHSLPMWGNSVQGCLVRLLLGSWSRTPRRGAVRSVRVPPAPSAGPVARCRKKAEGF